MKSKIGTLLTVAVCLAMPAYAADRAMRSTNEGDKVTKRLTLGRAGYASRTVDRPAPRPVASSDTERPKTIGLFVRDRTESDRCFRTGGRGRLVLPRERH